MRIAYIVLTCEAYEHTRKVWQLDTVFRSVEREDIYYLGHEMRPSDRVFSWGAKDDYDSLPYKFVDFFTHGVGEEMLYDWYFLMDDDTYLYVDRLKARIAHLNVCPQTDPYMEGHLMTHLAKSPWGVYHSGGAGTLLSLAAVKGIRDRLQGMLRRGGMYIVPHTCADLCLGLWASGLPRLQRIHVDEYHPEMSPVAGRRGDVIRRREELEDARMAITFHHLKTKEDFWEHWRLGRELEAENATVLKLSI